MPKIGARSDLKKTASYINRNLGQEAKEGVKAKRIAAKLRASLEKSVKARKTQKLHEQAQARRNQLERTPSQDWFNFEHEEDGYFTRRNLKTGEIEVFETRFPR